MPNIATFLRQEIARISRREIRKQVNPLRKASAAYRHEIAALKRQTQALLRRGKALAKGVKSNTGTVKGADASMPQRFVAKGLRSLRARLGLSQAQVAQLMGVSSQSVYNWEAKKATPRKEQLGVLATIRAMGKQEAHAHLEALAGHARGKQRS